MDSAQPRAPLASRKDGTRARRRLTRTSGRGDLTAANPLNSLPLPQWIGEFVRGDPARSGQVVEHTIWQAGGPPFAAGAAIFAIDRIVRSNPSWLGVWRMRLTFKALAAGAKLLRLNADEATLRDAQHLTRAGDDPGPSGPLLERLRRWASHPLRLASETEGDIAAEAGAGLGASELAALLAADRALAGQLGWATVLPLHPVVVHDPRCGTDLRHCVRARISRIGRRRVMPCCFVLRW
jgi:Protein of unknown function (DUF1403)